MALMLIAHLGLRINSGNYALLKRHRLGMRTSGKARERNERRENKTGQSECLQLHVKNLLSRSQA